MSRSLLHGRQALIAVALAALTVVPAARADFQGTPGKIAVIANNALLVYDPAQPDQASVTLDSDVLDYAPSWSPDGTKIAYVKDIDDPGRSGEKHSAIFEIALADGVP